jgi:hypothetical protein
LLGLKACEQLSAESRFHTVLVETVTVLSMTPSILWSGTQRFGPIAPRRRRITDAAKGCASS